MPYITKQYKFCAAHRYWNNDWSEQKNKEVFDKAQSDGKVVVVNSWTKYCSSCARQMKVLNKAKNEFDNIEYFTFEITNKEIAKLLNVQYQTTLLIFKDNKEIYRSIGETIKSSI